MYIKRKLSQSLTTYKSLQFPCLRVQKDTHHRYQAVVGIGGNMGDMKRRFNHLFVYLKREKRCSVVATSLLLKNPPFGYVHQDDFLNAVMVIQTSLQPREFLRFLLRVEKHFGRKREFANGPRTLDLDIIFFDNRIINTQELRVPHPHWFKRNSVVIPLEGIR